MTGNTQNEDAGLQSIVCASIASAMTELRISRAELARRLKVSRATVTEMFNDEQWTIQRLQRVVEALGASVTISLRLPAEKEPELFDALIASRPDALEKLAYEAMEEAK
jgi:transcriptional regulator with XRE-family HTH domain